MYAASSWSIKQGGPELFGIGDTSTAWTTWQTFRHPFYEVINNSPTNQPSPGDLVFFRPNTSLTGPAGHVDIAIDQISTSSFRAVDSNWNNNRTLQYVNHGYNEVVGWFHPTNNQGGNMAETTLEVEQRLLHGPGGIDEWIRQTAAAREQVNALQAQVAELQVKLKDAQNNAGGDQTPDAKLGKAFRQAVELTKKGE